VARGEIHRGPHRNRKRDLTTRSSTEHGIVKGALRTSFARKEMPGGPQESQKGGEDQSREKKILRKSRRFKFRIRNQNRSNQVPRRRCSQKGKGALLSEKCAVKRVLRTRRIGALLLPPIGRKYGRGSRRPLRGRKLRSLLCPLRRKGGGSRLGNTWRSECALVSVQIGKTQKSGSVHNEGGEKSRLS